MEAIGRLAGGIAHDFNNLLMVISGYSEFLLERLGPDPRLRGPAQEISNATQRATSLTRQLLAFSRKQMLAPKVLDLNEVVAENLKMLTRMIGEDIDLVMVPGPTLGSVRADPGQIDQVIMNIAVNARDAMPQGGKLTIETANVTLDENFTRTHAPLIPGDYVMLAISDTGVGMDNETQARIFEPFFTTKGSKGTGLGLSMVYGIVKQSGGFIFVDSQPQRGTSFRAYFPRVDGREDAAAAQDSFSLPRAERGQETILIVEDETNLRRLARQYLETQGYKILEAADGAAALQIVDGYKGTIDLLFTDVIMPGMNGRELAARVTELLPDVRVLYMSGYTENAVGHDGTLDAGISLLQKPFSLPALKDRVREVLDSEPIPPEVAMQSRSAGVLEKKIPPFRARRFNLHLPLRYRPLGEKSWRPGTTENISRSGMLFQAQESLHPSAQLEISLVLPAEIAGLAATEVICRGEVVRSIESQGEGVSPALAAKTCNTTSSTARTSPKRKGVTWTLVSAGFLSLLRPKASGDRCAVTFGTRLRLDNAFRDCYIAASTIASPIEAGHVPGGETRRRSRRTQRVGYAARRDSGRQSCRFPAAQRHRSVRQDRIQSSADGSFSQGMGSGKRSRAR